MPGWLPLELHMGEEETLWGPAFKEAQEKPTQI